MKLQKLLVNAAAACLLFGVSSAAIAVNCAGVTIEGTESTPYLYCSGNNRLDATLRACKTISYRI